MRVALLLLAVGVAVLAYRESESFARKNGVTPWRIPSWAWALIGFASLVLCAVLLVIARRTTKPPVSVHVPASLPTGAVAYSGAPAGWHPDPSGRFQLRYWNGAGWTDHVSTNGMTGVDRH